MLEIRDSVAIGSVGEYLNNNKDELLTVKNNLDNHIKELSKYYIGNDSDVIISKFLEASDKLKAYLNIVDYYGKYMKTLSSYDKENIKSSTKSLKTIVDEQIQNNNLLFKNMNIEDIKEGVHNEG